MAKKSTATAAAQPGEVVLMTAAEWDKMITELNDKRRDRKGFAGALEQLRGDLMKKGKMSLQRAGLVINTLRRVSLNADSFLQLAPQLYPWGENVPAKPDDEKKG